MPEWKKEVSLEDGKKWTDWVCGKYRLEQGRDSYESKHGRPWLLTKDTKRGIRRRLGAFETLEAGQDFVANPEPAVPA